jgi:hypothetical protein
LEKIWLFLFYKKYKGKSSLIPLLFPGLNNKSITKLEELSTSSYVDVLCNDENNENWIIADCDIVYS